MNQLPEVPARLGGLYEIIAKPLGTTLLFAGVELGVFSHLDRPSSAAEVAATLGTHPGNTELFLDGLAAINLVTKNAGLYQDTPLAQAFLAKDSPSYLGGTLAMQLQWEQLDGLTGLVKHGPPSTANAAMDIQAEDYWAEMTSASASYQLAGIARQAGRLIRALPEFPSMHRMLDLGGGPGLIGMAIVAEHPTMEGVIFDLPAVAQLAESYIAQYGMEGRMGVLGGSYLTDPIGDGYDLIWASSTLNFARHDLDSLFAKVHDALNPGGIVAILQDGISDERTKPTNIVLSWLPMALAGHDFGFEQGRISDALLRVGFESVQSRTLETDWGPLDLDVARR